MNAAGTYLSFTLRLLFFLFFNITLEALDIPTEMIPPLKGYSHFPKDNSPQAAVSEAAAILLPPVLLQNKDLRSQPLLIYIPNFWWDQHPLCISESPEETHNHLVPSKLISPLTTSSEYCCVPQSCPSSARGL